MFKPAERRYCPCLDTSQVEEINEEIKYPNLQNFLPLNVSWGKFQEKKAPNKLERWFEGELAKYCTCYVFFDSILNSTDN